MSSTVLQPTDPNTSMNPNSFNPTENSEGKMGIGAENVGENGMGMGMDTSMSMGVNKPKSMEFHRQQLKEKLDDDSKQQTYVSPSDTILSPCTQKLSALKNKRFGKVQPKSLFAKMSSTKPSSLSTAAANDSPFSEKSEAADAIVDGEGMGKDISA